MSKEATLPASTPVDIDKNRRILENLKEKKRHMMQSKAQGNPNRPPHYSVDDHTNQMLDTQLHRLNEQIRPPSERRIDDRLAAILRCDEQQRQLPEEWHTKPSTSIDRSLFSSYAQSSRIPISALTIDRGQSRHPFVRCVPGTQTVMLDIEDGTADERTSKASGRKRKAVVESDEDGEIDDE